MKRLLTLCLALAVTLGMFAGCGAAQEPTVPSTELSPEPSTTAPPPTTEPKIVLADLEPPKTPEEFLFQLNLYMEEHEIPLTFALDKKEVQLSSGQGWKSGTGCVVCIPTALADTDTWITEQAELRLHYDAGSKELIKIEAILTTPWTGAVSEYHKLLSVAAASLCLESVTEEAVAALYDHRITELNWELSLDGIRFVFGSDTVSTVIEVQPPSAVPSLTVAELEAGLNAHFAEESIPLECAFAIIYISEDINEDFVLWEASFRFTSWDDPNTQYAVPKESYGIRAYYEQYVYQYFAIQMQVVTQGADKHADIYSMYCDCYEGYNFKTDWDASWQERTKGVIMAFCKLWTRETGDSTAETFTAEVLAKEDRTEDSRLHAGEYYIDLQYNQSGPWFIRYIFDCYLEEYLKSHVDENILDPQRLDYQFTFDKPILQDGRFYQQSRKADQCRYRTDIYSLSASYGEIRDLWEQYLSFAGTPLQPSNGFRYGYYWQDNPDGTSTQQFRLLDSNFFGWEEYGIVPDNYSAQTGLGPDMFSLRYSNTAPCPVSKDYLVVAAIGLSQITDEAMTVQEAIALHLQPQEVTLVSGSWQISYYAPRDIAHILCKNPETGMTQYYVLPLGILEEYFGTLETFVGWYGIC